MTYHDNQTTSNGNGPGPRRPVVETTPDEVIVRLPSPGRMLRTVLPDETVTHLENAGREQLMALRSLIDAAIKTLDQKADDRASEPPKRVDIKVE